MVSRTTDGFSPEKVFLLLSSICPLIFFFYKDTEILTDIEKGQNTRGKNVEKESRSKMRNDELIRRA